MKQKIFKKEFVRDHSLILQDAWYRGQLEDVNGDSNPYSPINIYYVQNGAVDIWENQDGIQWYKDKLLEKNLVGDNFFKSKTNKYKNILDDLKTYWSKDYIDSVNEFKRFVDLMTEGTKYFLIFYYSAYDSRTPVAIRDRAQIMRQEDHYYEDCQKLIRRTVNHLWPNLINLDIVLTVEDFDNMPDAEVLIQRKKNFVYIPDQIGEVITLRKWLNNNKEYKFLFDKIEDENCVKGQVAFKADKIKGLVRIVKNEEQVANFFQDEILVSPMTTEMFVPAIKKAAAIVTDEGGITCHAAIISREMKVPCVIGTKVATQIFQDGDMVEVDAERGIVKKI